MLIRNAGLGRLSLSQERNAPASSVAEALRSPCSRSSRATVWGGAQSAVTRSIEVVIGADLLSYLGWSAAPSAACPGAGTSKALRIAETVW